MEIQMNQTTMIIHIPKIKFEALNSIQTKEYQKLNSTPYGGGLANKIANKLMLSKGFSGGIYFAHRDYCGLGIFYTEGIFKKSIVYDGYSNIEAILQINSRQEFIDWLSKESDQSMAWYGTKFNKQTITKSR